MRWCTSGGIYEMVSDIEPEEKQKIMRKHIDVTAKIYLYTLKTAIKKLCNNPRNMSSSISGVARAAETSKIATVKVGGRLSNISRKACFCIWLIPIAWQIDTVTVRTINTRPNEAREYSKARPIVVPGLLKTRPTPSSPPWNLLSHISNTITAVKIWPAKITR